VGKSADTVSAVRSTVLAAAVALVVASPAAGRGLPATQDRLGHGPTSLVEIRSGAGFMAAPVIRGAGGTELAASVGVWRVPTGSARRILPSLRRAGLVRLVQPERTIQRAYAKVTPDPLTSTQWWRADVRADQSEPPGPGKPVTIVDVGVDLAHPEFAGRPDTAALNTQRVTDSRDDFHGTAVASVAAAPANGVGIVGIYPQATLHVYDADLSGRLTDGELIRGIDIAASAGPGVINLSLGGTQFDPALQDVIYSAIRRGSVIVAASGNSREEGNPINFPANMSHVLTVAATDSSDHVASFSSSSVGVDIAAPGVDIPAAVPTLYLAAGFTTVDGTSFSAPMVAGAAAWVWTARPDLDNTQLFDIMRWSARDVGRPGFDVDTGFGVLDVPAALIREAPPRDPQEPNDDIALVKPGALFAAGEPALTKPGAGKASLQARIDVSEDPEDVYRVWVPARKSVTVTLHGDANVDLEVWKPAARTVAESGSARKRDLAGASERTGTAADALAIKNTTKRGAYYYADVFLGRGVGDASYSITVTTR
jgi:subtilase family protein